VLQRLANESESCVGGEIRFGFRNDEAAHRATSQVMRTRTGFYRYPLVSMGVCRAGGLLRSRIQVVVTMG
jgi:hypothetical protein